MAYCYGALFLILRSDCRVAFVIQMNSMAGGGRKGEVNEDGLDKSASRPSSYPSFTDSSAHSPSSAVPCILCIVPVPYTPLAVLNVVIDFIQEHALHQGDQSDESAAEQFKDERIADAIRTSYQQVTGHQFPIKDKN